MATEHVLVDTNVISFVLRGSEDAERYAPHLRDKLVVVSFMTVAELERWTIERNWGEKRRELLEENLRSFVIHPYNRALTRKWAEVMAASTANARPISHADAWIAATALLHEIPLVTDNVRDFVAVDGLTLIHEPRADKVIGKN